MAPRLNSSSSNPVRFCYTYWKAMAKSLVVLFLFQLSYYLGSYQSTPPFTPDPISSPAAAACPPFNLSAPALDFRPHHSAAAAISLPTSDHLPTCPPNFTDYCPCHHPARARRFVTRRFFHRERHCPGEGEKVRCLVPRPEGYRTPISWPASKDAAWFANVPFSRLVKDKRSQNWVRLDGERLVFPGGGTSFRDGAAEYVQSLGRILPLKDGVVRTALDTGCGVASFGAHLLEYNILTMSIAPRDIHEAQVQFALERGLPAMLGVLSTYRLPFPARAFDMAHCSRCLIHWAGYGGLYLSEIDRVLRPGGYWVLSGPPISWKISYKGWERKAQDLQQEQADLEDMAKRLCWKKVAEKGIMAIWQKPTNHLHCLLRKSKIKDSPPFCLKSDHDSGWYRKLESCITPLPKVTSVKEVALGVLEKWPQRLFAVPPRLSSGSVKGITSKMFLDDNNLWSRRVSYYAGTLPLFGSGRYRNVMDMNAGLGGFAAAMAKYPVWVMNVVPKAAENDTLGVIYERGLIGTYMDWCEAFSTYPRTYDFIHANGILKLHDKRCDMLDILLEMYRIIRPEGAIVIRDHVDIVTRAKTIADQMKWQSHISHSEQGPFHSEKLLFVDNSVQR